MAYRHAKIDDREYNFKIWKPYDLGGSVIIRYCREGIRCEWILTKRIVSTGDWEII